MANPYVDFLHRIVALKGPWTERFVGTLGLFIDGLGHAVNQATKGPWLIRNDGVPEDALTHIGDDSLLERYPLETRAGYEARIQNPWEIWELAGGPERILSQLAKAGWPGAVLYSTLEWPSSYWSQFWIFFPQGTHPVIGPGPAWGGWTWGDGTTWGPTGISQEQIFTLRAIIRKFKSARWICRAVIFELSGWSWGTGHTWGDGGLVWGGEAAQIGV